MFIREDSRNTGRERNMLVHKNALPYLAAVKRGLYTLTNPVYGSNPVPSAFDQRNNPAEGNPMQQQHVINIDRKAFKNNHKYYQHLVMTPEQQLPKAKSHVVMNEQRELYRQHRKRMANIKGKVNTNLPAPTFKIEGNHMELSYMEMLTALYRKSNNTLRTFTKSPERLAAGRWRNTNVAREKERKQQEQNKKLYQGGGLFDPNVGKSRSRKGATKPFTYEIPMHVLHRYEKLMPKCDVGMLCKLLRPQVYFDVEVRGTRVHGRLAIQLFTEACPEVVLQFMRLCTLRESRRICFTRTFAPIWLEGKVALDSDRTLDMSHIEHDFEVLNHGVDAGILSFPSRYVRGSSRTALNFTISFKPLSILNGKRIAFGKIRKGLQLLERIQDATSHLAKPHDLVVMKGCGVL
ncbi:uncharacterized protein LOC115627624 [Scaptodrosophila lebanonensis]|uniref:Uncharacterized protein LOC115627624 n=1 Tax=Drosophila lebanonensis TaxID=7225 RepID=A0A6J2TVP1_DROLE|nr:uncharacterized protein LOC115627624 [Scaptodrosophila lebanonensis]